MKFRASHIAIGATLAFIGGSAFAWGADGHHTVGAIADKLIAGSRAQTQVDTILGGLSLQDAAVWADCAKGVDPNKAFAYTAAGRYAECKIFETPELEAEMSDFVRRNDTSCPRQPGDESCHKQYHYSDEAIQRSNYALGSTGTRAFDVVAAVAAATHVLAGDPAPAPFSIKDKREALLLLAHYVGDIHQPLHVGAIYLDSRGARVDPDSGTFDPATETRGANNIITVNVATNRRSANLHQTWDDIPESMNVEHVGATWLSQARKTARTKGTVYDWPTAWASESLKQARASFSGLKFGPEDTKEWTVPLACAYNDKMSAIKKQQLTAAGARLAQILQTIWP